MGSLPAPLQRALMILLPPLSIAVCCFVVLPRQKKLRQIETDIKATAAMQTQYLAKLAEISDLPKDPRVATLPMTKEEQGAFLRGISQLCTQTGNKIISIAALAAAPPPAPPPPGTAAPPPAAGAMPPDVVEIKSTIVFEGNFLSLRDFLGGLHRSRRLVSLADCRIGPGQTGYPVVQTSVSIIRYVDNPTANVPVAEPAQDKKPQKTAGIGSGAVRS